jgi:DNA-damage-inducible protein D
MSKILSAINNSKTPFEAIKHLDESNQEFWLARELQKVLEYVDWRNFDDVIEKAKIACEKSENLINSNFVERTENAKVGFGERETNSYKLTRYACYLIAMNGDSKKEVVAQVQTYFAVQTRKQEILEENSKNQNEDRPSLRKQFTINYIEYKKTLVENETGKTNIGKITSLDDKQLFGKTTKEMKKELEIPKSHTFADYLAPVPLIARTLGIAMTTEKIRQDNLVGYQATKAIHQENNQKIREVLLEQKMPPEDFDKMERI